MKIQIDDLGGPEIFKLLQEHLDSMAEHSPPESVHALDLDALKQPDVFFWTAWEDQELLGCGALKKLSERHGEIKSMRTATQHLRKGVAASLLKHIIDQSKKMGIEELSLETGSMEVFLPARKLYESFGFEYCGPFADYVLDPYSVFMTRFLN